MVNIASWLAVLNLISSISALPCEYGSGNLDGACTADLAMVSLRQLVVQRHRRHRGEQLNLSSVGATKWQSPTCAGGRLLPEVYVLGPPKSATTEISEDMNASGIVSVAAVSTQGSYYSDSPAGSPKEFHYFLRSYRSANHTFDVARSGQVWFESLPACSEPTDEGERMITADYTPNHLAMAPPGSGFSIVRTSLPSDAGFVAIDMPQTLLSIYSHYMGAAINRVRFIINLREPLSRMQSHWYHMRVRGINAIPFLLAANFSEDVRIAVDGYEQGRISLILWFGLYGRQLQQYVAAFAPSQFFLLPYLYYTSVAKAEVCGALSLFLDYPLTCEAVIPASEASMHTDHPSVEEDVAPDLIERFQQTIAAEKELLVQQLTMAHQQGATLAHFAGSPSAAAVEEWLTRGW